jgi:hypothetical protein
MVIVISSNSLFYHNKNSNNDSYSYYHIAYADANANTNGTNSSNVIIPKGSVNPQVDISKRCGRVNRYNMILFMSLHVATLVVDYSFFNDSDEAKSRILRRGIQVYQIQNVMS